ncbi:MAG: hypothetical protein WD273_04290 [Trueperaceae bacterium]
MNRALLGVLILVGVLAFAVLQAWMLRRWTARRLDAAALEMAESAETFEELPGPQFSKFQARLYIGSIVLSWALFTAGAILGAVQDYSSSLSMGLVISSVVILYVRTIVRIVVGRAARRAQRPAVGSGGDAG